MDCGWHERQLLDRTEGVLGSGNPMVLVSTLGMGGGSLPVAPQVSGAHKHRRGMRPAGGGRPLPQKDIDDLMNKRENAAVRPLPVEAAVFSLGPGPRTESSDGWGEFGWADFLPSRPDSRSRVVPCDTAVSTATEAIDDEGDPSVVCASRQRNTVVLYPMPAAGNDGRPMMGISVLEPLEHSVLEVALNGRTMEGISVLEPLSIRFWKYP